MVVAAAARRRCELAASKVESARSWVGCVEGAVRTFVRQTLCRLAKKWPDNGVCLCLRVDNLSGGSSISRRRRRWRREGGGSSDQSQPRDLPRNLPDRRKLIIAAAFSHFFFYFRRHMSRRFHCRSPPVVPSRMAANNVSECWFPSIADAADLTVIKLSLHLAEGFFFSAPKCPHVPRTASGSSLPSCPFGSGDFLEVVFLHRFESNIEAN